MATASVINLPSNNWGDHWEYWRRPTYFTPVRPECYCLSPDYLRITGDIEYHFVCKTCMRPISGSKADWSKYLQIEEKEEGKDGQYEDGAGI